MHLNIGLALPQTLLLVHVAGHLPQPPSPPLPPCASPRPPCRPSTSSLFTCPSWPCQPPQWYSVFTLCAAIHQAGKEERESEQQSMHQGWVWQLSHFPAALCYKS